MNKINGLDRLFGDDLALLPGEEKNVIDIPLGELQDFKNHPFYVKEDEAMEELVQSILEDGIITPLIVRRKTERQYETISGHRRRFAASRAGLDSVPCLIVEATDEEAVNYMVSANLQRPEILPSEKAFAYKLKMEQLSHQGKNGSNTAEQVGEEGGDSGRQVQRYIRLTFLNPTLLELVDAKKLTFGNAVTLSYLTGYNINLVSDYYEENKKLPTTEQCNLLKEKGSDADLSMESFLGIMEKKKKEKRKKNVSNK
ncbi:MAG: ParB/RepB/Spo0J family partition protein [Clostridiaceae bacterium]|nr:ParB/RepB/Spo0J family partition protein [Clostridiaceae bacterium]